MPDRVDVTVPCSAVSGLPGGSGTLVATGPVDSPDTVRRGMTIGVTTLPDQRRMLEVVVRNTPLLSVDVAALAAPGCGAIVFSGDSKTVKAEVRGITGPDGKQAPAIARRQGVEAAMESFDDRIAVIRAADGLQTLGEIRQ